MCCLTAQLAATVLPWSCVVALVVVVVVVVAAVGVVGVGVVAGAAAAAGGGRCPPPPPPRNGVIEGHYSCRGFVWRRINKQTASMPVWRRLFSVLHDTSSKFTVKGRIGDSLPRTSRAAAAHAGIRGKPCKGSSWIISLEFTIPAFGTPATLNRTLTPTQAPLLCKARAQRETLTQEPRTLKHVENDP